MKKLTIVVMIALIYPVFAIADTPIAKCVSAEGELIFTDHYCETAEAGHNPFLMTESAINPSVRARIPSVVKADAIAASKLKSVTKEAQTQCEQRFGKYFKQKHPSIDQIPEIKFTSIVDQFLKGSNISVSLSGKVEYTDQNYAINSNIECTVQRFKPASEWLVGYRER